MSVFADLCMQARKLGATRLIFTAELSGAATPEGICGTWTCVGGEARGEDALAMGSGRTGEEALRLMVDQLERGRR